ncbi:hypothetical protein ACFQ8E_05395 [Isoptericola sp. NPDC056573]|uniref:hypothetical protein n=1 Tax=Isoptericola sp. NPDC056573 TaxID=3345868 RepID=UPI00369DD54E
MVPPGRSRPTAPTGRRARRAPAAGAGLVLAVLLAACSAGGTGPGDGNGPRSGGHGEHGGSPGAAGAGGHAAHDLPAGFTEALERVTTDRGTEILEDGLITKAEVQDLQQVQVDCLVGEGFDASRGDGGLQVRAVPDGLDDAGVAAAVEGCLGDLVVIGPLEAAASSGA